MTIQRTQTAANTITITLEDGERVYPCWCGMTHRGEYGIYAYGHHVCFHPFPLRDIGYGLVICGMCGNAWELVTETINE